MPKNSQRPSRQLALDHLIGVFDGPTTDDNRRLRKARGEALARYAAIESVREAAVMTAFRAEIDAVVRSASPLLISLLALDGLTLDDAVALMRPAQFWPDRQWLSGKKSRVHAHLRRFYPAGAQPKQLTMHPYNSHQFNYPGGDYLLMQVIDHSLELFARIGPVSLQTLFGELRVEFDIDLPEVIFEGSVGWTIDNVVDHEALNGRGWRIIATADGFQPLQGQTLFVAVGSVPYRVTWPEPDQK